MRSDPDIRARFLAVLAQGGGSIAQAAREAGLASSTLSRWARGEYGGDNAAVERSVAAWLRSREASEQRAALGVDAHVDLAVTRDIESVLDLAQAAADVVVVHGRSGCGKTWAARRFAATRSAVTLATASGAWVTLAGMLGRVAAAVGAGDRHPSALAAESRVIERLAGRRSLLVVDEAHHLSVRQIDELRCVRDIAGCGLALIGSDMLWSSLCASPRADQITGRVMQRLALRGPSAEDVCALAASALRRNPERGESRALVQAARGGGGLHVLRRTLARTALIARADGAARPTAQHTREALAA